MEAMRKIQLPELPAGWRSLGAGGLIGRRSGAWRSS